MAPLPSSASAHFSLISSAVSLTEDESKLGFYFAVFALAFSVSVFICLRKIYSKSIKALFVKSSKSDNLKVYRNVAKNILLTLLPMAMLFIPVSEGTLLIDYFDKFLTGNGLYLTGVACVINALILLIARWYAKQENRKLKRVCGTMSALRMSVYQLVSFIVPGFSHVSSGATNMLMSDVHPKVIMREVYLYLAPSMFVVNLAKIIRYLVKDTIVDAVSVAIGAVIVMLVSYLMMKLIAKFNPKKVLSFFSIYSALLGIGVILFTFII
jgi:undecaprenyl pyrophosphate phosphatase UppP